MKVFISADMEGITGVSHWDEVEKKHKDYCLFQKQMTAEVVAACTGAFDAGASEVWVKDAHDTGRNLIHSMLPGKTTLIRGWSGHPFSMVQELDATFHAVMMVGYHSRAGSGGNPLAHTMSSSKVEHMWINDRETSEFLLHAHAAASVGVPVVLVTGDDGICEEVKEVNSQIKTVSVKTGVGDSTVSLHPDEALRAIQSEAEKALASDLSTYWLDIPDTYHIKIRFVKQQDAYRASHYPGASLADDKSIRFETSDYMKVMKLILFTV